MDLNSNTLSAGLISLLSKPSNSDNSTQGGPEGALFDVQNHV